MIVELTWWQIWGLWGIVLLMGFNAISCLLKVAKGEVTKIEYPIVNAVAAVSGMMMAIFFLTILL